MSLALFTKGWVPKSKKGLSEHRSKKRLPVVNGGVPLKMSSIHKGIFESMRGRRRLLQSSSSGNDNDGEVLVSNIVVVNPDGSGNFTNITAAVAAAPTGSNGTNGYFLIYVTAGVYEEYVTIQKNNTYLMMVGDGINQTVITGNHSMGDGWTTFNSATFSEYNSCPIYYVFSNGNWILFSF